MCQIEAPKGAELGAAEGIGGCSKKLWANRFKNTHRLCAEWTCCASERLRPALANFHFQSLETKPERQVRKEFAIGKEHLAPSSRLLRRFWSSSSFLRHESGEKALNNILQKTSEHQSRAWVARRLFGNFRFQLRHVRVNLRHWKVINALSIIEHWQEWALAALQNQVSGWSCFIFCLVGQSEPMGPKSSIQFMYAQTFFETCLYELYSIVSKTVSKTISLHVYMTYWHYHHPFYKWKFRKGGTPWNFIYCVSSVSIDEKCQSNIVGRPKVGKVSRSSKV